jgi:hypothetical protein
MEVIGQRGSSGRADEVGTCMDAVGTCAKSDGDRFYRVIVLDHAHLITRTSDEGDDG